MWPACPRSHFPGVPEDTAHGVLLHTCPGHLEDSLHTRTQAQHTYTRAHTHTPAPSCTCTYAHMHSTLMHTHARHTQAHSHTCTHAPSRLHTRTQARTQAPSCTCTHKQYILTLAHTCTQIHRHRHTDRGSVHIRGETSPRESFHVTLGRWVPSQCAGRSSAVVGRAVPQDGVPSLSSYKGRTGT